MRFFYLFILCSTLSFAQVGINTETPNALLDITTLDSTNPENTDGLLIPKIDEYPSINPTALQDGMMVFATGVGSVPKGFYFWDNLNTSWSAVSGSAISDNDWFEENTTNSPNSITDEIYTLGNVAIGKNTADYTLDIESNTGDRSMHNLFTGNTIGIGSYIYGIHNTVIDTGDGFTIGAYNVAAGGTSSKIGTFNNPGNTATSNTTGTVNQLFNVLGNGTQYGTEQRLTNNGGGLRYGTFNFISGTQATGGSTSQPVYGSYQRISINSQGDHYGSYNEMMGNGLATGNIYGNYNNLGATTQANQYGSYTIINTPSISGTNYGVFSQALFPNSYAGYFLGNVTIGTTNANTYTLPTIRGTANQIIQTDGAGNASWVDPVSSSIERINDLVDGRSDYDGTNDGSSVFIGVGAGLNDDISDNENVGVGYQTLSSNTVGALNVGVGNMALSANISGISNVGIGKSSLASNTSGIANIALGSYSLFSNTEASSNVGIGHQALNENISGNANTAIGRQSIPNNTFGGFNVAIGAQTGAYIEGNNNIFIGYRSAGSIGNRTLNGSIFLGYYAGHTATESNRLYIENSDSINPLIYGEFDNDILGLNGDVAIGHQNPEVPLHIINEGTENLQNIVATLASNTSNRPVLLFSETTSSDFTSGMSLEYDGRGNGDTNRMSINNIGGSPLFEFRNGGSFTMTSGSMYVNHPSGAASEGLVLRNTTDADTWRFYTQWNSNTLALMFNNVNVGNFDDVSGVYTSISDRNLKENISSTPAVLEKIKELNVVDYNFKLQTDATKHTGLIAQEVESLFPNLVVPPNEESKNYTMDYSGFGVLAIKAIQEQQEIITQQQKQLHLLLERIETLEARNP